MAGVYLGRAGGQEGSYLQEFIEVLPQSRCVLQCTWNDDVLNYHFTCHVLQKVMTFTRRMACKLSCMRAEDAQGPALDRPEGSRSRQTRSRHTAALDRPEGSRSRPRAKEGGEDGSDDDSDDPPYEHDELRGSQLFDAPYPTQSQVRVYTYEFLPNES